MLDSHPDLAIPPETHFCHIFGHPILNQPVSAETRRLIFDAITQSPRWSDFSISPADLRDRLEAVPHGLPAARCLAAFWELYAAKRNKRRWGDKTPSHIGCAGRILALLPEAKIVHLVRDGRDVACSMRSAWFGRQHSLGAMAEQWAGKLESIGKQMSATPDRYLAVRYEDLVERPREVLRTICDFLALEFDPRMLRYHERAEERLDELADLAIRDTVASRAERIELHRRTLSPPRSDRVGRWRGELRPDEIESFEDIAGSTLRAWRYPLGGSGSSR